jgi:hypothetical protein
MVEETGFVPRLGGFLFPHIFRSFRLAIQPSKLAIAFLAVAVIGLAGWLLDLSRTVVVVDTRPAFVDAPFSVGSREHRITELDLYIVSEAQLQALLESRDAHTGRTGVVTVLWQFCSAQFHGALYSIFRFDIPQFVGSIVRCARALVWAVKYHPIPSIVLLVAALVVLSLAGGAICRISALQFARNERLGPTHAVKFATRRFTTLLAAPIAPVVIALLLGLPIILLGLIGNIPVAGELLTGILLPLALFLAPFIAIFLIGAVVGLILVFPAIAYEDSDFFDAISRSFSSLYGRPWRMGFYALVALVYGAVCYLFMRFFVFLLLWVTRWFLLLGIRDAKLQAIWPEPGFAYLLGPAVAAPEAWSLWLAALLIRLWVLVVIGLLIAYVVSFFFSAATIIYALMRNRVDGTPLDEVYGDAGDTTRQPVPPATAA